MRRHLTDMQRLMEYMKEEMEALENRLGEGLPVPSALSA